MTTPKPGDRVSGDRRSHVSATPKPGDRVRVTFEAEYQGVEYGCHAIEVFDANLYIPSDAVIELIQPVDDPSKDPVGTVRRGPAGDVTVKTHSDVSYPWTGFGNFGSRTNQDVTGWKITGVVPGTPAAELNPVSPPALKRIKELLASGKKIPAIKAVREVVHGMGLREAKEFVESLPEHQQCLDVWASESD